MNCVVLDESNCATTTFRARRGEYGGRSPAGMSTAQLEMWYDFYYTGGTGGLGGTDKVWTGEFPVRIKQKIKLKGDQDMK